MCLTRIVRAAPPAAAADGALQALGWAHQPQTHRVKTTTTSLNTFFTKTPGLSKPGAVDVMVVDVEVSAGTAGAASALVPGAAVRSRAPSVSILLLLLLLLQGMEWPIFRTFRSGHFRPKLVIVEIQQLQRRYADNARAQVRARARTWCLRRLGAGTAQRESERQRLDSPLLPSSAPRYPHTHTHTPPLTTPAG
jgi:hypothetical protein